ncbi:ABC transporter permease [Kineothrix sp. MB12-C1]|uniref:ABC transporter permease n=1 Tax=Kineothrix sp. MB12-C1 TaxID=3070215 RepID=UPI0027D2F939|nr:ABC transporter permease subunit [Kineothrix sp. MB12-C1]WMC93690.1 ABC transporter permease subunit [Kineothrix sp. MB12-C1]
MIISSLLFLALLGLVLFLPSTAGTEVPVSFVTAILLMECIYLFTLWRTKKKSVSDIIKVVYAVLILWEIVAKLGYTHPVLLPSPEKVFHIFYLNWMDLIAGLSSSMIILLQGIAYAMILGIFGGLFVGYVPRLRDTLLPITRVISSIPPLVYTPYVVALMPSFRHASIFIIFSAVFWPNFMSMIAKAGSVDPKIIDSARAMEVSLPTMLFKIILPYSLPDVIGRLSISLTSAMLCLTGAEMLGASAGLGYFVKKYSDYADYTRVIAGIIWIAIVVTILNTLVMQLQKRVIKWK